MAALLLVAALVTRADPRAGLFLAHLQAALGGQRLKLAISLPILPALFSGTFGVLVPLRLDDLGGSAVTIGGVFLVGEDRGRAQSTAGPLLRPPRPDAADPGRPGGGDRDGGALPLPSAAWLLVALRIAAVTTLGLVSAPAGALLSDASEACGLDQGFAFGLMSFAWAGGQVVGGAAGGGLADLTADAVPYAVVAVVCASPSRRSGRGAASAPQALPPAARPGIGALRSVELQRHRSSCASLASLGSLVRPPHRFTWSA